MPERKYHSVDLNECSDSPVSCVVRKLVSECKSRYRLSKLTGIQQAKLTRIAAGEMVNGSTADNIFRAFGLSYRKAVDSLKVVELESA